MSATSLLGALTGALGAAGLLALFVAVRTGPDRAGDDGHPRYRPVQQWRRYAAAVVAAVVVLVATRWVAVAAAVAALVLCWRPLFGAAGSTRRQIELLDALATWTESLRDLVATGAGLIEALPASVPAAAPRLLPALGALVDRLHARDRLPDALRGFADDIDDVAADLVVAALLLNAHAQGRQLHAVLSSLATSTRAELAMRRAVAADRSSTRRGVQIVLATTVVMALGLRLLNPAYVAPYQSPLGQCVLAVVVGIFTVGFGWLHRLAQLPTPARFVLNPRTTPGDTAFRMPAPTLAGDR